MKKEKYRIHGMTCAACVSTVERSVCSLEGVEKADVNLLTSALTIEYDEKIQNSKSIIKAVQSKGYNAELFQEFDRDKEMKRQLTLLKTRISVSLFFMVLLMYVSMGKMMGLYMPAFLTSPLINGGIQFALSLPVFAVNYKYFKVGFSRLVHLDPNMDSLIATGSASSFIYSVYAYIKILTVTDGTVYHLYVDSAVMILTLITVGKYLEMRAKNKTSLALRGIESLAPEYATVIRDGSTIRIKTSRLLINDIVLVHPGENLPSDGIITKGKPSVNCSVITGESLPVDLIEGDEVSAGTTNLTSSFEYRVTSVGSMTTLGKMITMVEEAAAGKAPIARLADKVASVFVPVIILIAIISATVWFFITEDIERSLSVGVSVLVIACPCSLGLATPTAIMAGTGKGAENGVLFRSAEALETLCKADTVILDKTGTITEGVPEVIHVLPSLISEDELLSIAACLESGSEHPIASAILKTAQDKNIIIPQCHDVNAIPGYGIRGSIDGIEYRIGNTDLISIDPSQKELSEKISELEGIGHTVVSVSKLENGNDKLLGMISLSDKIRVDSISAVEYMDKAGINTVMITGDNKGASGAVANKVGIKSYTSNAKPEDKEKAVREFKEAGRTVVMIGDGVNDAPALARADIGVAIGSGTDIAIENSDVVLIGGRLTDFCNAIRVSRSTMRVIRQNLFWAFFYNCIGVTLAVAGIATPMIAAAAMSLSSVSVVSNALRLRFIKLENNDNPAPNVRKSSKSKLSPINHDTGELSSCKMQIEGMMCSHCKSRVESALNDISGVNASVDLENNCAHVFYPSSVTEKQLKKAVTEAGYRVISID